MPNRGLRVFHYRRSSKADRRAVKKKSADWDCTSRSENAREWMAFANWNQHHVRKIRWHENVCHEIDVFNVIAEGWTDIFPAPSRSNGKRPRERIYKVVERLLCAWKVFDLLAVRHFWCIECRNFASDCFRSSCEKIINPKIPKNWGFISKNRPGRMMCAQFHLFGN